MAVIIPFNGISYDPRKVDATLATAPPYDIVTPGFKEELYQRSPYNVIRVDFGKDRDGDNPEENRYTRAAGYMSEWLREGILVKDSEPSLYCCEITYQIAGRIQKTRGFLCAVKIEELGKGRVHPHEMTYSKPKSDRLNILRYCSANTSPIYSLYSSEEKTASSIIEETIREDPLIEAKDEDGAVHRLWRISDRESIGRITEEMSDRDVFIADGHHRYETALAFQKEMTEKGLNKTGEEPFNYALMFLANMEDDGLTLLPTHRIVEIDSDINIKEALREHFEVRKAGSEDADAEQAVKSMFEEMKKNVHSFGMFLTNSGTYYTLTFNGAGLNIDLPDCQKNLDVTVLHEVVFKKLLKIDHYEYEMDHGRAVERARQGSFEAVFFLNPTRIQDVKNVALAGHRMPPKSTYFYPKLRTGMVIYKF